MLPEVAGLKPGERRNYRQECVQLFELKMSQMPTCKPLPPESQQVTSTAKQLVLLLKGAPLLFSPYGLTHGVMAIRIASKLLDIACVISIHVTSEWMKDVQLWKVRSAVYGPGKQQVVCELRPGGGTTTLVLLDSWIVTLCRKALL